MKFKLYNGNLMGLPTSKNHLNFRWKEGGCKVLFSVCQVGEALSIHLASNKNGKKRLREAVEEFCSFLFDNFKWCKMIIGNIEKTSVMNLAEKCGFTKAGSFENVKTGKEVAIYYLPR